MTDEEFAQFVESKYDDGPDQSDKEMFDAQMISTLKDRVKKLESRIWDLSIGIVRIVDWLKYEQEVIDESVIDATTDRLEALLPKENR